MKAHDCFAAEKARGERRLPFAMIVDDFIDIGVPDWRLNKMPDLYGQAILQKDLLMADGLSELEVNELEELLPKINYLLILTYFVVMHTN